MWNVTLKGILAHKIRLLMTSVAVVVGVSFVSGSFVLTDTMDKTFDDMVSDIYRSTDAVVRGKVSVESSFGADAQRFPLDQSLLQRVLDVEGVARAAGYVDGFAQVVGKDDKAVGNPQMGAPTFGANWSDDEELNVFTLYEGRAPRSAGEVVIDKATADSADYRIGDRVKILTSDVPSEYELVGITKFGSVDSPGGAQFSLFTLEEAQRLFGLVGQFDNISVRARSGISQEEVRNRIAAIVPTDVEVLTGKAVSDEMKGTFEEMINFFSYALLIFAGISLLVGAFIINNTFSILVAQRLREMALLRAIGASGRQIMMSVLIEALAVGLIASAVAIFLGLGVAILLRVVMNAVGFDLPSTSLELSPRTAVVALVVGISSCLLSAILPARRAAKVSPLVALRESAFERSHQRFRRSIAGLLLSILGVVCLLLGLFAGPDKPIAFVGLGALLTIFGVTALGPVIAPLAVRIIGVPFVRTRGVMGHLARENAIRNPKRTSSTAAALMIGVAMVVTITVFAQSAKASVNKVVDGTLTSDFIISSTTGFNGGISTNLTAELKTLDELDEVSPIRYLLMEVDGDSGAFAWGIEPASFSNVFKLQERSGRLEDLGPTQIAVSADLADDKGWLVGTTVPVEFAKGGSQQFTVGAIYEDKEAVQGQRYLINIEALPGRVLETYDNEIWITTAEGVSDDDARKVIEEAADPYVIADVQDLAEYKRGIADMVNQLLGLVYVLLALSILVALFGIANTLALSVFERTRELGLLRALGMTRAQLRSMVRSESIIISLFGSVLGLLVGVFFGSAFVRALQDEGITVLALPFGLLVVVILLGVLAGVLAAVFPGRRAGSLNVLGAVATE